LSLPRNRDNLVLQLRSLHNLALPLKAFGSTDAFCWYAAWDVIGFFGVLFFVRGTKGKMLKELDMVFNISASERAAYGVRQFIYFFEGYVFFYAGSGACQIYPEV
jgi:hypothetical protein